MQHQNKHVREKIDVSIQNHLNEKKNVRIYSLSLALSISMTMCVCMIMHMCVSEPKVCTFVNTGTSFIILKQHHKTTQAGGCAESDRIANTVY